MPRVSRGKKRGILSRWGVGIFYDPRGWQPGYPKPGDDRPRSLWRRNIKSGPYKTTHRRGLFRDW